MAKGRLRAALSLMVVLAQLSFFSPLLDGKSITDFSGGAPGAEVSLGAGGTAVAANLSVPVNTVPLNGTMVVSPLPGAAYPLSPSLDIGADGIPEWKFDGTGYGPFGCQDLFSDGSGSKELGFPLPGNASVQVRLPGNAVVQSASAGIEGDAGQPWWNSSWHSRVPMTVAEQAGGDQADFPVETLIDTRNWTVASAEREFRVTRVNTTTLEETEVPVQVLDEINNGSRCFEAALVFAVQNLTANGVHNYYLYFNNPGSAGRSALYRDFEPRLIRSRLSTQTSESSFFGPFHNPCGGSFDASGNYWVTDPASQSVFGYTRILGTLDQPGYDSSHFNYPNDVVVTPEGRIAVSDSGNTRVQVFEPNGSLAFTLGQTGVFGWDNSHFNTPKGLGTDSDGYVYVVDQDNERLQIFDANGTYLSTIGTTGVQGSGNYELRSPSGLYVTPSKDIYIADAGNHRIQTYRYMSGTSWLYNYTIGQTGVSGTDNSHFTDPFDVAADSSGKIYIADTNNNRVQVFKGQDYLATIGTTKTPLPDNGHLNLPYGIAVSPSGQIFISDMIQGNAGGRVQVYDSAYRYVQSLGARHWAGLVAPGASDTAFDNDTSVAADASGRIFVSDSNNQRVQIFSPLGEYLMTLGTAGVSGADLAHFYYPRGLDVSAAGEVLVADGGTYSIVTGVSNQRVLVFKDLGDGIADGVIGVTSIYGNDSTHLNQPWDVAVNGDSVTAVADKGFMVPIFPNPPLLGQRVQVYSDFNDSLASRTYGVSGQAGLDAVHLAFPHGVGISGTGAVFVADTFNNRVVEFDNDGNGVADLIINPSGQPGGGQFQLAGPMDVDADSSGEIYVADTGNHRVQLFNPNGMYQGTIGETGVNLSDAFHLNWPAGIKTSADGQIYIADSGNNRVLRITPARLTMGSVERLDAPENVDIDIGADGSPDWSFGGVLVGKVRTAELAPAVNSALAGLPNVTDQYGIGMVLLTLNVSNARTGRLVLSNLTIIYDCAVDVPDFAAAVTMYVTAHAGEAKPAGNVSVPVVYTAASAGGVRLGGLDLLADFPPDLVAAVPDRALDEETAELALYNFSDFFSDDFDAVLDFSLVDPTNYTIADIRIVNRSILSVDCTGAAARLWHGSIDFRVKATDSRGLSAVSNPVRVTVRQMNHAPRITSSPPSLAARVGREWSYSVEAVDADGDALNFSLAQAPAGMGIDALSGQILWTPAAGQEGAAEVDVRATDGLLSDEQGFFVNVTNGTGRPPVITSTPAAVAEIGIEYTYQVTAADDGNATLSYSLDLFPEGMTIGNASGLVRWTPEARQAGANEVAVRVSNPQLSATQTFNVTVGEHAGVMPTITIAEPAPNATVRGTVWLRGIAYAGVGSVELVEVSLDGSGRWEPATGKSAWAYRLDTTRLSNGPHQVNLRVRNTPGDTAQANLTINVDNPRSGTAGATITIFGLGLWLWITLIVIVIAVVGVAAYAATRKRPPPAPMQATYAPPPPVQASPAAFAPAPAASAAFAPAAAPPAASASPAPAAVAAARAQAPAPPQRPLQRTVAVDSVFLIYHDGRLITYFSRSESIKLDDTLDMIRKFVKASFAGQLGRLDSMRYENMSIIMERGNLMYMVVITPMSGHDRLRREMRCLLEEINSRYRVTFKIWDGDFNRVKGVKTMIEKFAGEEVEEAPGQKDEAVPAAPRPAQEAPSEPAPAGPYGPAAGVEEPRRSAPPPPSETGTEPPKTSAAALTEAERLRLLEDRFLRGEITELTYTELRKKLTKK